MLKQRVITALVLLLLALPALFHHDPRWLGAFGSLLMLAAAWEWGKLNGLGVYQSLLMSLMCGLGCAFLYAAYEMSAANGFWAALFGHNIWLAVGACWVLLGGYLLRGSMARWQSLPQWFRLLAGLLMLCSTWLAMYQAKLIGTAFLISSLGLVWIADIAAYFAGRRWGRRKLAPHISPGKSWEGVLGGMLAVQLFAAVWLTLEMQWPIFQGSLFAAMLQHGCVVMVIGLIFLTAMSVVGDLIESLIKRSAGAKDSSQLLPGHGGVLDRMDAILPTLPLALMISLF